MPVTKATNDGSLNPIGDCYISIPDPSGGPPHIITMNNLPDISDSKMANYSNSPIIGRSAPLYTYSNSGDRNISIQIHLFVVDAFDAETNLEHLRWLQSACYPTEGESGVPFSPPPICQIRCGDLLAKGQAVCAVLNNCSVKFPTEVAWDIMSGTFCPYRLDIDTQWIVVYNSSNLPFRDRIVKTGYI